MIRQYSESTARILSSELCFSFTTSRHRQPRRPRRPKGVQKGKKAKQPSDLNKNPGVELEDLLEISLTEKLNQWKDLLCRWKTLVLLQH